MKFRSSFITVLALCALAAHPLLAQDASKVRQTTSGLRIGESATNSRIGFYGTTPAVQPTSSSQAALTDSTTGTASTTLAAGAGVTTITFPIENASIANGDILVAYVPGYAFKILKVTYVTNKPVTTAAKLSTITPKITGNAVTGGVLSLTSAAMTPIGALVAGTLVTAANTGTASDSITLTASATTAFVEGSGSIVLQVQNMDTANAFASQARQANALRSALVTLGLVKGS